MRTRLQPLVRVAIPLAVALVAVRAQLPVAARAAAQGAREPVLAEAARSAERIADPSSRASLLARVAATQAQTGDPEAARVALGLALAAVRRVRQEEQQGYPLQLIAIAQARLGMATAALETARSIPVLESRRGALREMVGAHTETGQIDAARRALTVWIEMEEDARSPDLRTSVLISLARAQAKLGQQQQSAASLTEAAQGAFQALAGSKSFTRTLPLEAVVPALLEAGRVEEARDLLARSAQLLLEERSASAVCRVGQLQVDAGASAAAGDTYRSALEVLGRKVRSTRDSLSSDLGMIAQGLAQADLYLEGLQVARTMPLNGPKARAMQQIAAAQVKTGQKEAALAVLGEALAAAREAPLHPSYSRSEGTGTPRSTWLRLIAETMADAGRPDLGLLTLSEALECARPLPRSLDRTLDLTAIAEAQGRLGEKALAAVTIREALASDSQITPQELAGYCAPPPIFNIVNAQVTLGDLAGALQSTKRIKHPESRSVALGGVVDLLVRAHRLSEAFQTARSIPDPGQRGEALLLVGRAQAGLGR